MYGTTSEICLVLILRFVAKRASREIEAHKDIRAFRGQGEKLEQPELKVLPGQLVRQAHKEYRVNKERAELL